MRQFVIVMRLVAMWGETNDFLTHTRLLDLAGAGVDAVAENYLVVSGFGVAIFAAIGG
ncbi:hypothetical protein PROAA_2180006 [Candidatus Propionivibrio aalborgensis]|uniref:Uncharacterized protein n=1 Tax=Candidatus Propionivibrio aalborgensis TaxID=1860101 RepID=A0A1A8XQD7_9RHOO|nr:hypothetical protein PROAA_2180006 [Candidatus Propionivibrio aalborgensis]